MNYKMLASLLLYPSLVFSYWQNQDYRTDVQEHRDEFHKWIGARKFSDPYDRVLLTTSCTDCDYIPKHPDAGKVFENDAIPYQVMHNGIKVVKDGYCAPWMTDLIYGLKGHHEPQEEKVFYEVLKYIPNNASMLELGSYWGFYSLWFTKDIPNSRSYLIEPDQERLDLGKTNFKLNDNHSASFFRGYLGNCGPDAGNCHGARKILIDSFLEENHIEHLDILHSDIQGSEYDMLLSAIESIQQKKIDYFFISTHGEHIHQMCLDFLQSHDFFIIAEHAPKESFSVDGLIAARRHDLPGCGKILISKKNS